MDMAAFARVFTTAAVVSLTMPCALGASAQQQYDPCRQPGKNLTKHDGECWRSLTQSSKSATIEGIWAGQALKETALDLVDGNSAPFWQRDWAEVPEKTTIGDIIRYFDRLYETPANREIWWRWAYILAAMDARDDDSDDRLSLIRLLRQHGEVPVSGTLVGAKDASTVIVRTASGKTFDIHLDGLNGQKLTPQQRARAVSFINGLRQVSYLANCDKPNEATVRIVYPHSIFRGENRLAGDVRIGADYVCLGRTPVDITDIAWRKARYLSINAMLLSKGLVHPETAVDAKWPSIYTEILTPQSFAKRAEDQSLYIYGRNIDAYVDQIIRVGDSR